MFERINSYLSMLYPPEQAAETLVKLNALIDDARMKRTVSEKHESLFDEQDVVLITYGDTLRREGEVPLQTLQRFATTYLKDAFSAIHILPFYPYSSDDGFSVQDFYAVNPALGDWPDIERLSTDFELMFDAVFNHMSAQSEWFNNFLANKPGFQGMFMTESPETDLSLVTRPRALPLLTAFQKTNGETIHVWTTFSADQVDFDVRHPETLLRLVEILLFYVEKGARLIRLDAIAYLWKEVGTTSIHLKQTHDVIRLMRAVLDAVAPETIIITETNVPHAENVSYFGDGTDEAQMVYNFTLPPLLFHTLLSGDATKLRDWVDTLSTPSDRTTFFNFTASHDGIGVRPVEGILSADELEAMIARVKAGWGRVNYKRNSDGTDSPYELNMTYVDAIINPTEAPDLQVKRFVLSQAVAMSLAGVPAIYIHSLLGSRNDLDGMAVTGHNRTINRAKLDYDMVEKALADERTQRAQIFEALMTLLRLRRQQKAFHPNASQQAVDLNTSKVFGLLRSAPEQRILALFNITPQPQSVDLTTYITTEATDIVTGAPMNAQIVLSPYQVMWIAL
ncbi:MAG: sugar phosphorylase [Anaerolineae bacterium]